jgi:hypothetical protein
MLGEPTEESVIDERMYYPSKKLEKELGDLAKLAQDKDWDFPNGVIAQLVADAETQRVDRIEHEAARTAFIEKLLENRACRFWHASCC